MKTQWFAAAILTAGLGGLAACADTDTQPNPSDTDAYRSGAFALSSEVTTALADLDVRKMRFHINEVACTTGADLPGGFSRTVNKDLIDILLPDGIDFSASPQADLLDTDSKHVASDHYQVVPGDSCFDVETTPLQQNGTASADCAMAQKKKILVEDGRTTEVMLINQCKGEARGGLDVISTLNRPPAVGSLEFERSKFIATCPFEDGLDRQQKMEAMKAREVCVRATDPEEDPLSFEWRATSDQTFTSSITNLGTTQIGPGEYESCARVAPSRKGDYGYEVIVRDLDKNGQPIEEILDPAALSRDNLRFPFYNGKDCRGRTGTILMAMTDFDRHSPNKGANNRGFVWQPGLGQIHADKLIKRMASWVSPLSDATQSTVAYIIDNDSSGRNEHPGDEVAVPASLNGQFTPTVTEILEPAGGLQMSDLLNPDGSVKYDVVWFSNPGFPVDDAASYQTLREYLQAGGSMVLQGDDMTEPISVQGPDLTWDFFTRLQHVDNGVALDSCGGQIDNNRAGDKGPWAGDYRQEAVVQSVVGDLAMAPVQMYNYDDDINQVLNANPAEVIEISDAIYQEFDQAGQETCRDTRLPVSASDPILLP